MNRHSLSCSRQAGRLVCWLNVLSSLAYQSAAAAQATDTVEAFNEGTETHAVPDQAPKHVEADMPQRTETPVARDAAPASLSSAPPEQRDTSALAEDSPAVSRPKSFGDANVLVLGGSIGVSTLSYSNSSASEFAIAVQPSFDYFIGKPLSLGGYVRDGQVE